MPENQAEKVGDENVPPNPPKKVTIVENLQPKDEVKEKAEVDRKEDVLFGLAQKVKINLKTNKLKEVDNKTTTVSLQDQAAVETAPAKKAPVFKVCHNQNPFFS